MDGHTIAGAKKFQEKPKALPSGVSGPTIGLYRLTQTIAATIPGIMYGTSRTGRNRAAARAVTESSSNAISRLIASSAGTWTHANRNTRHTEPRNAPSVNPGP